MNNFRSTVFRALADPSRIKIIKFLKSGERCVCEIVEVVGFAQPTVSRHLKVLTDSGILKRRKEGSKMLYSITYPKIQELIDFVDARFIDSLSRHVIAMVRRGYR